ncbi:hypothetical protein LQZ21_11825 [Treponema sp. TIM-1]|uniref:beta strand repeat-containing protein n=1 Tax=Treponema sp. TIM-1 TaxID=2898417 RepID=UPI00397FEC35
MNKKTLFGMIALLSVSLLFFGCSTEASDSGTESSPTWPVSPTTPGGTPSISKGEAASRLAAALGTGAASASADGTVILLASTPINGPIEIPTGVVLSVPASLTLTVASGPDLTNNGTLSVEGGLTVSAGLFTNDGTVYLNPPSSGTTSLPAGLTNNGILTVAAGDTLAVTGAVINTGTITAEGTITATGTFDNKGTGTITVVATTGAVTPSGLLTNGGILTLNEGISPAAGLTNSGTITLATGETLAVTGAIGNSGTINATGGTVTGSGLITNDGTINAGTITGSAGITNTAYGDIVVGTLTITTAAITNSGDITVNGASTGAVGLTNNPSGVITVTAATPGSLAITGAITNDGTINANGVVSSSASITNNGILNVNAAVTSATVLNNNPGATITVGPTTGVLTATAGGIANQGTITVNGTVDADGSSGNIVHTGDGITIVNPGAVLETTLITIGDTSAKIKLAAGAVFSYDLDSYDVVAGTVTVYDALTLALSLNVASTLIVDDKVLTVNATITGSSGAVIQLIRTSTGSLAGTGVTAGNFYSSTGPTLITAAISTAGSYVWTEDIIGTDDGWLQQ